VKFDVLIFFSFNYPKLMKFICLFQRPPSSSLSYPGPGNDDVRSPGSGGTPGPLSQPPSSQQSGDNGSEAGKTHSNFSFYSTTNW
jgi:hypothetical protein